MADPCPTWSVAGPLPAWSALLLCADRMVGWEGAYDRTAVSSGSGLCAGTQAAEQ